MPNSVHARAATYRLGDYTLLRQITVTLQCGKVHALLGPNGAGKTTFLQLLAGEFSPTEGEVLLGDKPLHRYSKKELALKRAVMPQDVAISSGFTSEEVVMMGRFPHIAAKRPPQQDSAGPLDDHQTIVDRALQDTESEPLRERVYPTLSGGEQARVTMARVLAQQTPIIFLDEPTASLDPRHQHLLMQLASRHARQGGLVVAVLHDLNLAAAYADNVLLINRGQLHAYGPPQKVLRPATLKEVFQTNFFVTSHPRLSHPVVLSLPSVSTDNRQEGME